MIPCHYDTFPPIETDAAAFKADVESKTSSKVEVLQPGESFERLTLGLGDQDLRGTTATGPSSRAASAPCRQ